ncbi:MAG: APC family permease, partial [Pirellulaceae bacterium]
MLVWSLGGVIALLGALTFAELGGRYGRTGGQYEILRDAFGTGVGFVYVFCNATAIQAGAIAIIAYYASLNLFNVFSVFDGDNSTHQLLVYVLAVMQIAVLSLTNFLGVRWGSLAQNITVLAKLATLVMIIAAALFITVGTGTETVAVVATEKPPEETSKLFLFFAALVPVLFTFGGWQHALWIGGEVKNPSRNIPLAITLGVLVVTVVYLSANWAYFSLLGFDGVARTKTVAADAMGAAWPQWGSRVVGAAVWFSGFGVLNSQLLSGPRLICGMARDGRFFKPFAQLHPRFQTPHWAILLLGGLGLTLLLVLKTEKIGSLLNGVVMIDAIFFVLTSFALVILRTRSQESEWPFRIPFFPLGPVLFGIMEIIVLVGAFSIEKYRVSAVVGILWMIAATLIYVALFRHRKAGVDEAAG